MGTPKRPRDANRLGKLVVDLATGEAGETAPEPSALAERGRKGGVRGGPARAASLTPERRQEIARKAAAKRWGKAE